MAVTFAATNQGLGLFDYNPTMMRAETRVALAHPYGATIYRTVTSFS